MSNLRLGLLAAGGLFVILLLFVFAKEEHKSSPKAQTHFDNTQPNHDKVNKTEYGKGLQHMSAPVKPSKTQLDKMRAKLIDLREKAGADPHHAMRWIAIAKVYNNMGDYYKACQYLEKSLEMEPKFKYRAAVEEIIEQCYRKYPGLKNP